MSYLILLILLLLSFFFSGTETAMTAVSLPLLNGRAENGDKKAILPNSAETVVGQYRIFINGTSYLDEAIPEMMPGFLLRCYYTEI